MDPDSLLTEEDFLKPDPSTLRSTFCSTLYTNTYTYCIALYFCVGPLLKYLFHGSVLHTLLPTN